MIAPVKYVVSLVRLVRTMRALERYSRIIDQHKPADVMLAAGLINPGSVTPGNKTFFSSEGFKLGKGD